MAWLEHVVTVTAVGKPRREEDLGGKGQPEALFWTSKFCLNII